MENIVAFAQALADGTRWRMVLLVADGPLCVCELADILQLPQSTVSSHLQVIKKSGMLDSERCGKWIYYRLSRKHRPLLAAISRFFGVSPASDAVLQADAVRAAARLASRDQSCCPLPKSLGRRAPSGAGKEPAGLKQKATA